jgi:metal-dependent amidase/aminoacylase/carboxypeptidase family protein
MPFNTVDSVLVASQLVVALQTIVSRNCDPLEASVLSVGTINGGYAPNVICDKVQLSGTVRALKESVRLLVKKRLFEIASGIGSTFGANICVDYKDAYPITKNSEAETEKVKKSACCVVGDGVSKPHRYALFIVL